MAPEVAADHFGGGQVVVRHLVRSFSMGALEGDGEYLEGVWNVCGRSQPYDVNHTRHMDSSDVRQAVLARETEVAKTNRSSDKADAGVIEHTALSMRRGQILHTDERER